MQSGLKDAMGIEEEHGELLAAVVQEGRVDVIELDVAAVLGVREPVAGRVVEHGGVVAVAGEDEEECSAEQVPDDASQLKHSILEILAIRQREEEEPRQHHQRAPRESSD